MINLDDVSMVVGTLAILILFILKFWIAINPRSTMSTLRIAILWTSIYIFFLFITRALQFANIITKDQYIVLGGFAALIPLIIVIAQLIFTNKLRKEAEDI